MKILIFLPLVMFISSYGTMDSTCKSDAETLCGDNSKFKDETVINCLFEQIDKIKDQACKSILTNDQKKWREKKNSFNLVVSKCKDFVKENCPEALETRKNFTVCILMHSEKVNKTCKDSLNLHIKKYLPGIKEIQ